MNLFSPKIPLCLIGILLYATNPWRDLHFYETVSKNEGFGSDADIYIIGFAYQLMATIVFSPVAISLIAYGIGRAKCVSFIPRIRKFSWWALGASIVAALILIMEGEIMFYSLRYYYHWSTSIVTFSYLLFTYSWWCCSLTHEEKVQQSCNR